MDQFKLDIISPTRQAYSDTVNAVYVPTKNGTIGILPHHIPLFTTLSEGEIKIEIGNKQSYLAIGGGFMEVTEHGVTILVSRAVHADEINEAEIKKATDSAKEVLKNKGKGTERADAQAILRRSVLELKVLKRAKHRDMPNIS
jgi:F-type H+-transporting ATPase subunit epsilon